MFLSVVPDTRALRSRQLAAGMPVEREAVSFCCVRNRGKSHYGRLSRRSRKTYSSQESFTEDEPAGVQYPNDEAALTGHLVIW